MCFNGNKQYSIYFQLSTCIIIEADHDNVKLMGVGHKKGLVWGPNVLSTNYDKLKRNGWDVGCICSD